MTRVCHCRALVAQRGVVAIFRTLLLARTTPSLHTSIPAIVYEAGLDTRRTTNQIHVLLRVDALATVLVAPVTDGSGRMLIASIRMTHSGIRGYPIGFPLTGSLLMRSVRAPLAALVKAEV